MASSENRTSRRNWRSSSDNPKRFDPGSPGGEKPASGAAPAPPETTPTPSCVLGAPPPEPEKNRKQWTVNSGQLAEENRQSAESSRQSVRQLTDSRQEEQTKIEKRKTKSGEPKAEGAGNFKSQISDSGNHKSEITNHKSRALQPAHDEQLTTNNPQPTSVNPKSEIQNPESSVAPVGACPDAIGNRRIERRSQSGATADSPNPKSKIEDPKSDALPPKPLLNLLPYQRRWVEDDSKLKIVVKARQIGYSFAATLRAVMKCLERKTTWIFLSKGERQSRLLMEKVHDHIRSCGVVARTNESTFFEGTSLKQLEVRFPNGSVIYGLPANPDTARGYSGHVTLDEFAFHADADKIYAALFPTITRGYGLEVISTPNGTQGKFYELAKAAGLEERKLEVGSGKSGSPYFLLPTSYSRSSLTWSSHCCDIYDAVRDGLKIDINLLRSGCEDPSAWQQEFCCQFVSTAENFLSPELLAACLSAEAGLGIPENRNWKRETGKSKLETGKSKLETGEPNFDIRFSNFENPSEQRSPAEPGNSPFTIHHSEFFLGIDIGRRHDRTVLWVDEVQRLEPQKLETGNWKLENGNPVERGESSRSEFPVSNFQFPVSSFRSSITNHNSQITYLSIARLVRTLENTPFAEQLQAARELLRLEGTDGQPLIRRCCIDATGIGAHMAETLEREFGPRVEPVVFTAAVKEDLAFRTKRRMEARLTLLPDTREIRHAFSAVKKYITPSGNLRFDAVRTEAGHADEFWAKALADLAADPEAHRAAARAEDAFLADAASFVPPGAFLEVEASWSALEVM